MREFEIEAGGEKRILVRYGSSIPETIEFEAEPVDPDAELRWRSSRFADPAGSFQETPVPAARGEQCGGRKAPGNPVFRSG